MSAWLNDNLDWNDGEDFDKIEDRGERREEREQLPKEESGEGREERGHDPEWEKLVAKVDRETLCNYLEWMADYIEERKDGKTTTDNRVRITRNIVRKLRKK